MKEGDFQVQDAIFDSTVRQPSTPATIAYKIAYRFPSQLLISKAMKIDNQDGNGATLLLNSYSIGSLVHIFQTIYCDTP